VIIIRNSCEFSISISIFILRKEERKEGRKEGREGGRKEGWKEGRKEGRKKRMFDRF